MAIFLLSRALRTYPYDGRKERLGQEAGGSKFPVMGIPDVFSSPMPNRPGVKETTEAPKVRQWPKTTLHLREVPHGKAEAGQGEYEMRQLRTPVPRLGLVPTAAAQGPPPYTPLGTRTPLGDRRPTGQHEVPRVRLRSDRASLTRFFR